MVAVIVGVSLFKSKKRKERLWSRF